MHSRLVLAVPLAIGLAGAPSLAAQDPPSGGPKFEVASVKPSTWRPRAGDGVRARSGGGGGCPQSLRMNGGRVDFECATLPMLIAYAYRFSPDRLSGPDWMTGPGSPRFDVSAKLPDGAPKSQVPEMVRALLAERFGLAVHRGSATREILALVAAKGGAKLQATAPEEGQAGEPETPPEALGFFGGTQNRTVAVSGAGTYTLISGPRMGTVRETEGPNRLVRWDAPSITPAGLADLLDKVAPVPAPVLDMTGLAGRYRVVLEVSLNDLSLAGDPAEGEAAAVRAFNDGLRKLGLQLERRKGPVETIVVDHVEKTPTGN